MLELGDWDKKNRVRKFVREDYCDPMDIGAGRRAGHCSPLSATELGIRLGHWICQRGVIAGYLELAYLVLWQGLPANSWVMPAGVKGRNKAMSESEGKLEKKGYVIVCRWG